MEDKKRFTMEEIKNKLCEITVKAVFVDDAGRVLLLKRAADEIMHAGKYDLPGGGLDNCEEVEGCLVREVGEELGDVQFEIGPILYIVDFNKKYAFEDEELNVDVKGIRFMAFYKGGEIKLNPREHQSYEWLSFDEAIDRLGTEGFEADKRRAVQKAREFLELKQGYDGWKRSLAEMDNFRKRVQKEKEDFKKYCIEDLVVDVLPVLDNFEAALGHIPEQQKNEGWVVGMMHIKNQLISALQDRGVKEIEVGVGDELDESVHEALAGKVNGDHVKIKRIIKKGFMIDDRVIRPVGVEVE